MQRATSFSFLTMEAVNYHGDNQKFLLKEHVNCFIFSVHQCPQTVFVINEHYYAEIRKVLAGYSITSIVQNVYWLLSKISFHLCMDPEEITRQTSSQGRVKNAYNLHITTIRYFFQLKKTLKQGWCCQQHLEEHKFLAPYITMEALKSLHLCGTLGSFLYAG